jgi:hypothetical protein
MNTYYHQTKMFAAAIGHYEIDKGLYYQSSRKRSVSPVRPSKEKSVSPARALRSSSDKIVTEVATLFSAFEPEKTWTKVSKSFAGLTTSDGHTIAAFRESFLKREHFKLLEKVLALVPEDMKDNIAISAIIEKLSALSGATAPI